MSNIGGNLVKTRKEHRCAGCHRKFSKGSMLIKWDFLNQVENTGYCTWYVCPTCEKFLETHDCTDYDGVYHEGFAIEPDRKEWEQFKNECEKPEEEQK